MKIGIWFEDKEFYKGCEEFYSTLVKGGRKPSWYISPILVRVLDRIRNHFGKLLIINSSFRTPEHNFTVGGAKYSMHLYGLGCDFFVQDVTAKEVQDFCKDIPEVSGLGCGETFTHIDVRNDDQKYVWTYD